MGQTCVCLAVLAFAALAWTAAASDDPKYPSIPHNELLAAVQSKSVTLLDCNGTKTFKAGRIPGALDFQAVKGSLQASLPADTNALIVAYCGSETCGAYRAGADAAAALGYTNIRRYAPGIKGWKASNAPVETATAEAPLGTCPPGPCCAKP
jgi:rhodanese-related sulfurtransferase